MPITTTIVNTTLQGLRLPLTAVEQIANKSGSKSWPPSVAYDSFEAEAKKVLGSLLRDDELVREGRLIEAKVRELADAERLEVKAEQKRMEADAQLEQRQAAAEATRQRVEKQTAQREQQLEQEKAERERKVREDTRRREEAAAKVAEVREKAVTAQERAAERTRLTEESAALAKRSEALAATKRAQNLDEALETKKAQRKGA